MTKPIDIHEITLFAARLTDLFGALLFSEIAADKSDVFNSTVNNLNKRILYNRANEVARMGLIMIAVMLKKEIISLDSLLEQYPAHLRIHIIETYDEILKHLQLDASEINLTNIFNSEDKSA